MTRLDATRYVCSVWFGDRRLDGSAASPLLLIEPFRAPRHVRQIELQPRLTVVGLSTEGERAVKHDLILRHPPLDVEVVRRPRTKRRVQVQFDLSRQRPC